MTVRFEVAEGMTVAEMLGHVEMSRGGARNGGSTSKVDGRGRPMASVPGRTVTTPPTTSPASASAASESTIGPLPRSRLQRPGDVGRAGRDAVGHDHAGGDREAGVLGRDGVGERPPHERDGRRDLHAW